MSTTTTEANVPEVQELARQLLRRLIAERNLRTATIAHMLNVEAHTLRRMLNGSRAIALDEMVAIANYGGYSLDEHFGLMPSRGNNGNGGHHAMSGEGGLGGCGLGGSVSQFSEARPKGPRT